MADWTKSATEAWEQFCGRMQKSQALAGADVTEVIEDFKRHVDAEIRAAQLTVVTGEDMQRILARIGEPGLLGEVESSPEASLPSSAERPRIGWLRISILAFFGLLLPAFTLGFEICTRWSAEVLCDPIPNVWFILLIAFVPLCNLATAIAVTKPPSTSRAKWLGRANGFTIGICCGYSLLYLPFLPFAVLGLLFYGGGLMPLAPFLALGTSCLYRDRLRFWLSPAGEAKVTGLWSGLAAAVLVLIALALPDALTRYCAHLALAESPLESACGIHWLRLIGREQTLLDDCYRDRWSPWAATARPYSSDEARTLYFRMTGKPFNSVPAPQLRGYISRGDFLEDYEWDSGLGGEAVAGRLRGLFLNSSRLDGLIEPEAALGYYEWTMEFKNIGPMAREARAQIQLPPGGVVSRLTLWVNGEEREAAFAGRSQVREAYREVAIQRRRDPVLVTTAGPDRILLQCFPVPASGGTMKLRLGITAPLVLDDPGTGRLAWPQFLERNFGLPEQVVHGVWVESKSPLRASLNALQSGEPKPGHFVLHGDLTDQQLHNPEATIIATRPAGIREVWSAANESNKVVLQTIVEQPAITPSRLIIVVDGSRDMQTAVPALAAALGKMPEGTECAVLLASDEVPALLMAPAAGTRAFYEEAARRLQSARFTGGQDNVPALIQGWDLATASTNSMLLWVHGSLPVPLGNVAGLRQRLERNPGNFRLYDCKIHPGPNRILEDLDGLKGMLSLPRFGNLGDDLARFTSTWRTGAQTIGFTRELIERPPEIESRVSNEPSRHVTRLWGQSRILQLTGNHQTVEAVALAGDLQLVTPVSGAVVLETKAQYDQAGLKPTDASHVPVIPEPSTWALLGLGGVLLGGKAFCKRRASRGESVMGQRSRK